MRQIRNATLVLALAWTLPPSIVDHATARAQDAAEQSDEQAVREMLESTRQLCNAGDGLAYAKRWDPGTVAKELVAQPDLARISRAKKSMLVLAMGMGLRQGFAEDPSLLAYERMEVRGVEIDGDRAIAVIRGWDADDFGMTWRMWLVRKPDEWRIYDAEEVSQGLRISQILLAGMASILDDGNAPPWLSRMQPLMDAATASAEANWEAVEVGLQGVEDVEFPPELESMRSMLRAILALQLHGDPEAALQHAKEMVRHHPPTVAGELLRSRALLHLNRPSEVLPAVTRYMAVTGPDATALQLRGEALDALGRHEEAIAALRAASLDSPGSADVLGTWLLVADGDERAEPLRVFKTLRDPGTVFESIVTIVRDPLDADALDRLFEAMVSVRPDHPDLAYWKALRALEIGEAAAGVATLKPTIDNFRRAGALDDPETWPWVSLWVDLHQNAGTLLVAADSVRGSRDAFTEIGFRMVAEGQFDELSTLVDERAKLAPDDLWARVFRADVLLGTGAPADVEAVLAPLASGTGDEDLDGAVFQRRARAFAESGKGVEGYEQLGSASFGDLAWFVYKANDAETLLKIADRHEKVDPSEKLIPFYRVLGLVETGENEAALRIFLSRREVMSEYAGWGIYESAFRAALRSGDAENAKRIAEFARDEGENPLPIAIVTIAAGDARAAEPLVRECLAQGFPASVFLEDADVKAALAGKSMTSVREMLEKHAAE